MPFITSIMHNEISTLVKRYSNLRERYILTSSSYSEADIRADFIDPFFTALGWDLQNTKGLPQRFREVIRETRVNVNENTKKPDYEFKLGVERKFFVEAKKPQINIISHLPSAYQTRRYGWSANLPISILTNFEYLVIYDTTIQPSQSDPINAGRMNVFRYDEYLENLETITNLLSRESLYSGFFDENVQKGLEKQTETIDDYFIGLLNKSRILLAQDIIDIHPTVDLALLNEIVQRFILRILFLRMVEDRGIQNYQELLRVANTNDWNGFLDLFKEADHRFDSELFSIRNDPFFSNGKPVLQLNSDHIRELISTLYYPYGPYSFVVFDPQFLGGIYEQFLFERIINLEGKAVLQKKPENIDRDVVPTPPPIISRIVQYALNPLLSNCSSDKIFNLKILDPACGSGGFLISAFDLLSDSLVEAFRKEGLQHKIFETAEGFFLPFEIKRDLIIKCLYGVDRDYLAVEVTRFSLVVKLLENETLESLPSDASLLPSLRNNIVCGDSLIDKSIYEEKTDPNLIGIPITWGEDIICPFDAVIGNPPYLKVESMVNFEPEEYKYYLDRKHYQTSYKMFDKYFLFIERSLKEWLNKNGYFGMIVSNKFCHIPSGKKLRGLISRGRHLIRIIDFGNAQLFRNRITYTCILLLSKSSLPQPSDDEEDKIGYELVISPSDWLSGLTNEGPNSFKLPRRLISGEDAWILPNSKTELELIQSLAINTIALSEIFDVFNGIQTSRNSVYVISEWQDINEKYIAFEKNGNIWHIEKSILKPFFESDDQKLHSFYPMPKPSLIIFPYTIFEDVNGMVKARIISPERMRNEYSYAYQWLEHNKIDLLKRDIRPANYPPDEWYRFGRDQALSSFENRPKIVVGVNSLGDKYVYDEGNTLLASGGTAGEIAIAHFTGRRSRSNYDLHFIQAILNHKAIEYFCRKRGSPFQNGWFSRGTEVLKVVPIPIIDFNSENERRNMYNEVVRISTTVQDLYKTIVENISQAERIRLERRAMNLKNSMNYIISHLYGVSEIIEKIELPK